MIKFSFFLLSFLKNHQNSLMGERKYHQPHFPLCRVSVTLNYPAIAKRAMSPKRPEGRMTKWYVMKQSQWMLHREIRMEGY